MDFKIGNTGKGKSNFPPGIVEAQLLLDEYRHALIDGLGADGKDYKIACVSMLAGLTDVGIAFRLKDHSAYLLIDGTGGNTPEYIPTLLAREVTDFLQTRVLPVQASKVRTFLTGHQRGPIVAYKFRLADRPSSLSL